MACIHTRCYPYRCCQNRGFRRRQTDQDGEATQPGRRRRTAPPSAPGGISLAPLVFERQMHGRACRVFADLEIGGITRKLWRAVKNNQRARQGQTPHACRWEATGAPRSARHHLVQAALPGNRSPLGLEQPASSSRPAHPSGFSRYACREERENALARDSAGADQEAGNPCHAAGSGGAVASVWALRTVGRCRTMPRVRR